MFTRRTTLVRHQSQHSGPLDENSSDQSLKESEPNASHSVDDEFSDVQSSRTSVTPPIEDDTSALSPKATISQMNMQASQNVNYFSHNQAVPLHMRHDYGLGMHQAPPLGSTPLSYTHRHLSRPSITSNPASYMPPQPLEPPTNGSTNSGGSPHLGSLSWATGLDGNLPSPTSQDFGGYPDPAAYGGQNMYYTGNSMRYSQHTEPDDWTLRMMRHSTQNMNSNLNTVNLQDWNNMPLPEIKQERAYAAM